MFYKVNQIHFNLSTNIYFQIFCNKHKLVLYRFLSTHLALEMQ